MNWRVLRGEDIKTAMAFMDLEDFPMDCTVSIAEAVKTFINLWIFDLRFP